MGKGIIREQLSEAAVDDIIADAVAQAAALDGDAAGAVSDIQYHGASGKLDGDSDLQWDDTNKQLSLGGLKIDKLIGPLVMADNQVAPATIITYDAATYKYAVFEYSIERNNENRVGRLMVVNNGTVASIIDESIDTGAGVGDSDIIFSASISGSDVIVQYTSSSTGFTGDFKYSARKWN